MPKQPCQRQIRLIRIVACSEDVGVSDHVPDVCHDGAGDDAAGRLPALLPFYWCGEMLKPRDGDCCVFCSYADTPCPSKQDET